MWNIITQEWWFVAICVTIYTSARPSNGQVVYISEHVKRREVSSMCQKLCESKEYEPETNSDVREIIDWLDMIEITAEVWVKSTYNLTFSPPKAFFWGSEVVDNSLWFRATGKPQKTPNGRKKRCTVLREQRTVTKRHMLSSVRCDTKNAAFLCLTNGSSPSIPADENETSTTIDENETSTTTDGSYVSTSTDENETSTTTEEIEASTTTDVSYVSTSTDENETSTTTGENETSTTTEENETSTTTEGFKVNTSTEKNETRTSPEENETSTSTDENETSTLTDENETSTLTEENETSISTEENETSTSTDENKTSTLKEGSEVSTSTDENETSTSTEKNETSTPMEGYETSTSTEKIGTSTSTEQYETSTPTEQHETSTSTEQYETSTSTEHHETNTSTEQHKTNTSTEQHETSTSKNHQTTPPVPMHCTDTAEDRNVSTETPSTTPCTHLKTNYSATNPTHPDQSQIPPTRKQLAYVPVTVCPCKCTDRAIMQSKLRKRDDIENQSGIVNTKNLSSMIRRKTSARDNRRSSQSLGIIGVVLLAMILGLMILDTVMTCMVSGPFGRDTKKQKPLGHGS